MEYACFTENTRPPFTAEMENATSVASTFVSSPSYDFTLTRFCGSLSPNFFLATSLLNSVVSLPASKKAKVSKYLPPKLTRTGTILNNTRRLSIPTCERKASTGGAEGTNVADETGLATGPMVPEDNGEPVDFFGSRNSDP